MKPRELLKVLNAAGCKAREGKGSHLVITCEECRTVVSYKKGQDLATGTLRAIEKQLEPCLGKGWLK